MGFKPTMLLINLALAAALAVVLSAGRGSALSVASQSRSDPVRGSVAFPFYGTQYVPIGQLPAVQRLGFDVVLNDFSYEAGPEEWLAYLDAARRADLKVIAWLWPEGWRLDRRTNSWTIDARAQQFLRAVAGHPALFAVYGLHEPYWNECDRCGYSTAQQQALYRAIKAIAPVPVYSEINGFAFWADRGPATTIAPGVCDYCQTAFYPFRQDGSYARDELLAHMEREIAALSRLAPESKLIWTMQSMSHRGDRLRMPTPEEMLDYASIVYARPEIVGAWWYMWDWDNDLYPEHLSIRPDLHPTLRTIADTIVAPRKPADPRPAVPTPTRIPVVPIDRRDAVFLPLLRGHSRNRARPTGYRRRRSGTSRRLRRHTKP
jgi:hypothetical protein